jgi:RNA polymerase sigma factor (TIGR02999 family)
MPAPPPDVTRLLDRARRGDTQARDALLGALYEELRVLARAARRDERPGHAPQTTELVHEVCLRFLTADALPGSDRTQFRAYVAKAMRHVLIDHARERRRLKRGGGQRRVPLDHAIDALVAASGPAVDLLALDECLERLAAIDARKALVVELRYFGGLSVEEIAAHLEISTPTVKRDWSVARAWLYAELSKGDSAAEG